MGKIQIAFFLPLILSIVPLMIPNLDLLYGDSYHNDCDK
jgi:hypothetical protein